MTARTARIMPSRRWGYVVLLEWGAGAVEGGVLWRPTRRWAEWTAGRWHRSWNG